MQKKHLTKSNIHSGFFLMLSKLRIKWYFFNLGKVNITVNVKKLMLSPYDKAIMSALTTSTQQCGGAGAIRQEKEFKCIQIGN